MGFFDLFRRAPRRFDELSAPWGERPSIHDFLREAAVTGQMHPAVARSRRCSTASTSW